MQVPIVTLWKDGKPVDFNASESEKWISEGWSKEQFAQVVESAPAQPQPRTPRKGKQ